MESYLAGRTTDTFNDPLENIDEQWAALKIALPRAADLADFGIMEADRRTEGIEDSIDCHEWWQACRILASNHAKSLEVLYCMRRDKRTFVIALLRKAEAAADCNDFRIVYYIMKIMACSRKSFDDLVRDI